jgi:hypothetical protein
MKRAPRRSVESTFRTAATLLAVAAAGAGGCGSADPGDTSSAGRQATRAAAGGLVGKWVAVNRCEELVAALRSAGLEAYTGRMLTGQYRPEPPRQITRDRNRCRGARSFEHSHGFETDGAFASFDESGAQVDEGTYRTSGDRLIVSRPPFDVTVRYRVSGDTATFDLKVPPDCETKRCRDTVALAIGTFFPRTYRREAG